MNTKAAKLLILLLLLSLAACGGGGSQAAPNEQVAATPAPPASTEPPQVDEAVASPTAQLSDEAASGDGQDSEAADSSGALTPTSPGDQAEAGAAGGPLATAQASGLPINPDPVVPGEAYIILGTVINVAMIPADAPQFLIEGDNGVRYRVNAQPVANIFVEDGSQLLPYQFSPGLRVMATALLPADATATDVAQTTDLVILLDE